MLSGTHRYLKVQAPPASFNELEGPEGLRSVSPLRERPSGFFRTWTREAGFWVWLFLQALTLGALIGFSEGANAVYWITTAGHSGPTEHAAAASYCTRINACPTVVEVGYGSNGRYFYYKCDNECVGGSLSSQQTARRKCNDGSDGAPGDCPEDPPPVDCQNNPPPAKDVRVSEGEFADGPIGNRVWDGCEFAPVVPGDDTHGEDDPKAPNCGIDLSNQLYCIITFAATGNSGGANDPDPDVTPRDPADTDSSDGGPPVTQTTTEPPTVEPNTPEPGDVTTTSETTTTTTTPGDTDVDNTTSTTEVTITKHGNTTVTQTTTTTTTTKADGSTEVTKTTDFTSSTSGGSTTTVGGSPASITTENQETTETTGSTTTTSTIGADGSGSSTTTHQGAGGDGSLGDGEGEGDGEDEEQTPFSATAGGGEGLGDAIAESWAKVQAAPIYTALTGFSVSAGSGSCTPLSVNVFGTTVSTTWHCDTWTSISGGFASIMLAVWGFMGVRIVLGA